MRAIQLFLLIAIAACSGPAKVVPSPHHGPGVAALEDSVFPKTPIGLAARRGHAILTATRDSLPGYVGNGLRCTSCHLDDGRRPFAMPWLGVHARYPQYRSRAGRVTTVEDRIAECLLRSLAGKTLPPDDERLRAIEAYFAFISVGTPVGSATPGQGIDSVHAGPPDTTAGQAVFAARCSRCHGADGAGIPPVTPVWGDRSFTIGAGMGRVLTAAGFIRHNMPFDSAGVLTDQQALNVAAYIDSRPRGDFAGKEHDWPKGGAPADVPYRTLAQQRR